MAVSVNDRCLRNAKQPAPCARCVDTCPVQAITPGVGGVSVSAACLGCGACAAECPTGALDVAGFRRPDSSSLRIVVECNRVPHTKMHSDAWTMPCMSGLRIADVVDALALDKAQSTCVLVDRGLCSECPASAGRQVAQDAARRLSALVSSAGIKGLSITVETGARLGADAALDVGATPARSRRAFLRGLLQPSSKTELPRTLFDDRRALALLAGREGQELGADQFPALSLTGDCCDRSICVSVCPTAALRRETAGPRGELRRLVFEPSACLACGRCAEACPEKALALATKGHGPTAVEPIVLRERLLPVCVRCEDVFTPSAESQTACAACRKGDTLFLDLLSNRGRQEKPSDSSPSEYVV